MNKEELVNRIFVSGEIEKSFFFASRIYDQKCPDKRHPHERCLKILLERFTETRSVKYKTANKSKPVRSVNNELPVLLMTTENPTSSQKKISDKNQCFVGLFKEF